MFRRLLQTDNDTVTFFMRIALGIVFFAHGAQKMLGWFGGPGPGATIQGFSQGLHIPVFLTIVVMLAEFAGAIMLIIGLVSRVAAFGIFCDMIGAVLLVHHRFGFFMNWSGKQPGEGFEFHILVLALSLAIMIKGSGRWSLDRALVGEPRAGSAEVKIRDLAA
jgi:putative oxidoreductase